MPFPEHLETGIPTRISIDDVTDKLKEIGPYVRHAKFNDGFDRWVITDRPSGAPNKMAVFGLPNIALLDDWDDSDWAIMIEEGKRRYERELR